MKKKIGELNLLGNKWKVSKGPLNDCDGICYFQKREIIISGGLMTRTFVHTYFHELFHAMLFESGVSNLAISNDAEELLVDSMSKQISDNWDKLIKLKNY